MRGDDRARSEENRYRPVECPGEDWTRTRWKQDHGCEAVSSPPLFVTLSV